MCTYRTDEDIMFTQTKLKNNISLFETHKGSALW